jgi:hypothetical protein
MVLVIKLHQDFFFLGGGPSKLASSNMKNRGFEGYFTVVDDHTQRAMNQLHRKFKHNQKWGYLDVLVFIFQRVTENYN